MNRSIQSIKSLLQQAAIVWLILFGLAVVVVVLHDVGAIHIDNQEQKQ